MLGLVVVCALCCLLETLPVINERARFTVLNPETADLLNRGNGNISETLELGENQNISKRGVNSAASTGRDEEPSKRDTTTTNTALNLTNLEDFVMDTLPVKNIEEGSYITKINYTTVILLGMFSGLVLLTGSVYTWCHVT